MNPKTFIFFGRSGCGKGTQAQLLIKRLESAHPGERVVYVETGAKLREFIKGPGLTQDHISKMMSDGDLLPAFVPIWIWADTFIRDITGDEHLVMDGLSRRIQEAPILHEALSFYNRERPVVIVLNISNETSRQRMLDRGRADDTEEDIKERLAWYETNVVPTIDYFRRNDYFKVVDIDGEQPVEKVSADIIAAIS